MSTSKRLWPFSKPDEDGNMDSPPPESVHPADAVHSTRGPPTTIPASSVVGSNSAYDDMTAQYNSSPRASTALLRRQLSYDTLGSDERTHLLAHHRPTTNRTSRGPLDPDDPAVSPYNLWTVRGLRWFTILFFIVSIGWWILLLVSTFISPPLMNSRGSGFYEFAYASVAVAILLVTLLFFTTPSRAEQYSCFTIFILLLINTIIILAVSRIRSEEGWVGITTVVWAMLMTGWCVLCDRVVEYGKAEEEERLTGRHETKRSLREWTAVFTSTLITMGIIAVTGFLSLTLIIRAHDASLTPYGTRYHVDSNKYAVHLFCEGNKNKSSVTVLLEAGEKPVEAGMEGWVFDAYKDGEIGRYCYWDRPGFGFSDNAPSPLSAGMAVDALSEALAHADEDGPYVLVSHGIGGIYSRIFAARHTYQIRGLLLIDNVHERDLDKIASPGRGFRLWLRGILSPIGPDRIWGWMFKGHSREDRIYGKAAYMNGKVIKAKLQENLVATTYTRNEINTARVLLPKDVPLVVVSSGKMVKHDSHWYDAQNDLSNLTDKLVGWDIVDNAPHEVWQTSDGKEVLTRRLAQLVKAY